MNQANLILNIPRQETPISALDITKTYLPDSYYLIIKNLPVFFTLILKDDPMSEQLIIPITVVRFLRNYYQDYTVFKVKNDNNEDLICWITYS